jgi:hypothetical protein
MQNAVGQQEFGRNGSWTRANVAASAVTRRTSHRSADFRTGPVERVDWANLIADCSGYFDRTSLASK